MKHKFFENLRFVVQYRRRDDLHGWIAMVAYDVDGPAIKYCDQCNTGSRPWAYRVVDAETGEAVHEPEPPQHWRMKTSAEIAAMGAALAKSEGKQP